MISLFNRWLIGLGILGSRNEAVGSPEVLLRCAIDNKLLINAILIENGEWRHWVSG